MGKRGYVSLSTSLIALGLFQTLFQSGLVQAPAKVYQTSLRRYGTGCTSLAHGVDCARASSSRTVRSYHAFGYFRDCFTDQPLDQKPVLRGVDFSTGKK